MIQTAKTVTSSPSVRSVWKAVLFVAAAACALSIPAQDGWASSKYDTPAGQALRARAIKACNGPQYPNGAQPRINYTKGTFQCVEPGWTRR